VTDVEGDFIDDGAVAVDFDEIGGAEEDHSACIGVGRAGGVLL
jgi:hypothetical protein